MLDLEGRIEARFPQWFSGRRASFSRQLIRSLARIARIDDIDAFVRDHAHLRGFAFVEAALERLDCRFLVDQVERERIPETGRVVIVANHPMGALDALALLAFVGSVRRDVRILANDFLAAFEGLSDLLIPLRVFGGRAGADSLRQVDQALGAEQAVIVFPAGEVSRLTPIGVRDAAWRHGFLRFAEQAAAPVVPVRIEGRNSALFYGVSALFRPLGTGLLPREMFARQQSRLVIRVGAPRPIGEVMQGVADRRRVSREVRRAVYAIGRRGDRWSAAQAPLAHRPAPAAIRKDLERLALIAENGEGLRIHAGRLLSDSPLLREIARLRELTFRSVGEGTGRRLDTDVYDSWYDHIVVWDGAAGEVAGAYRIADCARVLAERGRAGLYVHSLFDLDGRLRPLLECSAELGRSFVQPRYRNTRSLDWLWQGIGAWLRTHPHVRHLHGPVSISAELPPAAREQIVAYYTRYFGDAGGLVRAHHPFRYAGDAPSFGDCDAGQAMALLRARLDAAGARLPILYRQYTELCEPGGARFLAFGVDPAFRNSVDGLIVLDLDRLTPRKRARYLRPDAAAALPA
ncbi:MAG: lysophospholipid acyltransferase family protein [Dokdonella sp.]|nr:lysophospholipid acyltransferase family protein [Dokdonella sp.]